jgi:catechol 2,3-dioxygenase-like lactoylglutathione lyase family enzyme
VIFEVTYQIRVSDFEAALNWYKNLLQRGPDLVPHEGFAEWEIIPGCWLQVGEGTPTEGAGPFRFGVPDIEAERNRVVSELNVEHFEVHRAVDAAGVTYGTFSDPWGNRLGFFEYVNKSEEQKTIKKILQR